MSVQCGLERRHHGVARQSRQNREISARSFSLRVAFDDDEIRGRPRWRVRSTRAHDGYCSTKATSSSCSSCRCRLSSSSPTSQPSRQTQSYPQCRPSPYRLCPLCRQRQPFLRHLRCHPRQLHPCRQRPRFHRLRPCRRLRPFLRCPTHTARRRHPDKRSGCIRTCNTRRAGLCRSDARPRTPSRRRRSVRRCNNR